MVREKNYVLSVALVICCSLRITMSERQEYGSMNIPNNEPNRRFYLYNAASLLPQAAALIPQAAAALSMLAQPHYYRPPHYTYVEDSEAEEEEEYEHKRPPPVQLLTILRPQKNTKIKKVKGNKTIKKIQKCLPFKFKFLKRNDVERNGQTLQSPEVLIMSVNTSGLLNSSLFPEIMEFVYPSYAGPSPPLRSGYLDKKIHAQTPPKRSRPNRFYPNRWPPRQSWRVAPQGRPVAEFSLQEPSPAELGGSPPPSPLFSVYNDNRIPVSQSYINDAEKLYYTQPVTQPPPPLKYSEPDYYRYGTYNQKPTDATAGYLVTEAPNGYQEQTEQYRFNYAQSTEKIVTITPTPSWVPIPLHHNVVKNAGKRNTIKERHGLQNNANPPPSITKKISSSYLNCTKSEYCNLQKRRKRVDGIKRIQKLKHAENSTFLGNSNSTNYKSQLHSSPAVNDEKVEILTAKYPDQETNDVYSLVTEAYYARTRRSDYQGPSVVLSGSLLVKGYK